MSIDGTRNRLPVLVFLTLSVAHLGSAIADDVPKRIVVKALHPEDDDSWFEDDSFLWIRADRLSHELPEVLNEFEELERTMPGSVTEEAFNTIWPDSDREAVLLEQLAWLWLHRLGNREKYGSAKALGLEEGQLLVDNEVCDAPTLIPSRPQGSVNRPPPSFDWQAEHARAALIGRISKIAPGFNSADSVFLLEVEVEESLIPSAFAYQPFILLPIGSFVAEDTVYCSKPRTFGGYFPQVGDRIAVLPTTGPWNADRSVIALISHHELFVIDAPDEDGEQSLWAAKAAADGSTPTTLQEFREAVWRIHADKTMEAAYAADNEEAGGEDTQDGEGAQDEGEQPAEQTVDTRGEDETVEEARAGDDEASGDQ